MKGPTIYQRVQTFLRENPNLTDKEACERMGENYRSYKASIYSKKYQQRKKQSVRFGSSEIPLDLLENPSSVAISTPKKPLVVVFGNVQDVSSLIRSIGV